MPELKGDKHAILIIKRAADFRPCMKPIHQAESIKYIILVTITKSLRGTYEIYAPARSGIIIAHASGYQNLLFFSEIKN
jgi:hypothetical protein